MSPNRLLVLKFTRNYFAGNFFLLKFAYIVALPIRKYNVAIAM